MIKNIINSIKKFLEGMNEHENKIPPEVRMYTSRFKYFSR